MCEQLLSWSKAARTTPGRGVVPGPHPLQIQETRQHPRIPREPQRPSYPWYLPHFQVQASWGKAEPQVTCPVSLWWTSDILSPSQVLPRCYGRETTPWSLHQQKREHPSPVFWRLSLLKHLYSCRLDKEHEAAGKHGDHLSGLVISSIWLFCAIWGGWRNLVPGVPWAWISPEIQSIM